MTYVIREILIVAVVLASVLKPAKVQIAMPMYMPQAVYAMHAPIAVAIQLPEAVTTTTTTTTTTQPPNIAIAVPVPVPMPVQFAVPAYPPPAFCQGQPRPKSCPPCPPCVCMPSCTPAFFSYCSPCHLKCRCRNPEDAPIPMPPNPPVPVPGPAYPLPVPVAPVIGPSPVVVIPLPPSKPLPLPLPPRRKRPKCRFPPLVSSLSSSSTSGDTSDSCESSSDSDDFRPRFKRRRTRIYRRKAGSKSDSSDIDFVKPVVSYVSENGDIKFKTKISSREALDILNRRKTIRSDEGEIIKLKANDDSVIVSNNARKSDRRYNKVLLRDSSANHVLNEGKNKLIFKAPARKKINNIAVSFQVT